MSISEIFQIAGAIIVSVGGATLIIFALASWLGKVWATRIMEKEKHEFNKEIERYKQDLALLSAEHNIRFSELHRKQAEAIRILYKKLIKADNSIGLLAIFYEHHKEISEDVKENLNKSSEIGADFISFYNDNEILFPENICQMISALEDNHSSIWFNIGINQYFDYSDKQLKKILEEIKEAQAPIPELKEALKKEFRKLLGV